jgi:anionic cell wall polymer biosynthesis LytR-Cps2A-Psr (LCP) family protein/TM2 domain-containing membrane protein YozV
MQYPQGRRVLVRNPIAAAFLSALFPGAGQAAAGNPGRGVIVAIPMFAVVAAFLVILVAQGRSVLDSAFNQQWLTSLLILDLVALLYHVWAVVDAYFVADRAVEKPRRRGPPRTKWGATFGIAVILSGTLLVHAGVASVDMSWQNSLTCLQSETGPCFAGATLAPGQTLANSTEQPGAGIVDPSTSAGASGSSSSPGTTFDTNATFDPNQLPKIDSPTEAKNWAADGQLNILLAGVDAGLGGSRSTGLRPDTMIVLHVDIASGKAAMIGIPRNTQCVPLPQAIAQNYSKATGGCPAYTYPNMLNWLANDAGWNHPTWFPFYQGSGLEYTRAMTATEQAIGALTGLTIDGFVVINLQGLVTLIDDLGGIDINVPTTVYDKPCGPKGSWEAAWYVCAYEHAGYELPDDNGSIVAHMKADAAGSAGKQAISWQSSDGANIAFVIQAGQQHMDGDWALAYARTREFTTDYNRMMRQQLVIKSMRSTFDPCTVLPRIPSLVNHLGSAFWTNMPLTDASKWAGMAKYIVSGSVKSITLDPSTLGNPSTTYINATTWNTAKSIVAHSLDSVPAASASGSSGGGGGGFSC